MSDKLSPRAMQTVRETDLYAPVAAYFWELGYDVRSEVHHCDITAIREDELIVIELKKQLSMELLIQASERQQAADYVYIAFPRPKRGFSRSRWRGLCLLVRKLELGCILLRFRHQSNEPVVDKVIHPSPYQPRRNRKKRMAIIKEASGRTFDENIGGSTSAPIVTAYREQAMHIACCLEEYGPLSPAQLRKMGTGDKTQSILYANYYGWFERVQRGVYTLSAHAVREMERYPSLVRHYRQLLART